MRTAVALACLALLPSVRAGGPAEGTGELVDVVQVVSGDTLRIRRADGRQEEFHLLSVDAEEPTSGRASDGSKPTTAFGDATLHWLRALLREHSEHEGSPKVRTSFPEGERRDIYGRLLGHAALLDGRDISLMLVREGKSPYYNKYGNSLVAHDELVRAQAAAQQAELGIWSRIANASAQDGEERRSYPELIAWWNARAEAVEAFRRARAERPESVFEAEAPEELSRAAQRGSVVELFCEPVRLFALDGEAPRLVLRSRDRARPLELALDPTLREALASLQIGERIGSFRQNYLWLVGRVEERAGTWRLIDVAPDRCRVAGPEPQLPRPSDR